ncbi:MAG: pyridoxal phosphate-dependent aminotransferase [Clostridia bacterium]|nr:pyridoxal phosphate-dependent aminotransferase [Clostridia bacterium]
MLNLPEQKVALGTVRNIIRDTFEYGKRRSLEIGAENVFDFSLGNPSVPAPNCVNDKIKAILESNESTSIHQYTSAPGDLKNLETLAASLNRRFGGGIRPSDLYFTVGAAASLTCTFHGLTVKGDEYVVLAPFFIEYKVFIEGAGGKVVVTPPNFENFQPDFTAIEAAINENTKGVIINSPNNPSGVVYSEETIKQLAALLKKKSEEYAHPIFLIADEPYRELVFDGYTVPWVPNYYDNTIVCYSYSKSLSIPGERIGYILVPPTVCEHDKVYASICGAGRQLGFVNAPSLFQRIAAECDGETSDISVYQHNAELMYNSLTKMGFTCIRPGGTFYLLMKAPMESALEFCLKAREFELLLVPTDAFMCEGFVRIAYCVPTERIERALPAFEKLAKSCL